MFIKCLKFPKYQIHNHPPFRSHICLETKNPGCYWLGSQVANEQISKFITCMAGTPPRIFKLMKATGLVKSWWIPATKQLPFEVTTISAEDFQVDTHLFLGRFLSISSQRCKLQVRLLSSFSMIFDVNKETIQIADVSTLTAVKTFSTSSTFILQGYLHPSKPSPSSVITRGLGFSVELS